MNTYSARRPASFDWAKALLVSVVVHVFLVVLWIGAILLEVFTIKTKEVVEQIIQEDKVTTMSAQFVEALQQAQRIPEAPVEPVNPEKSFASTKPSQETTEEVTSSRYFGERSTLAASNGEIDDSGLEVPSQEGDEKRTPNDVELTDSAFADGDTEGVPGTPGEPLPLSQTTPAEESTPEEVAENQPKEPIEVEEETPLEEIPEPKEQSDADRLEEAQALAAELLAMEESIPVAKPEEENPEPTKPEEKEQIPAPKKENQPPAEAGGLAGNRGLEGGFEREAKKTRLSGKIRRRGESSLEVEDTVKGRFLAEVNREVEKAWQRECILRREHILPGVLSVSFVVDDEGKVTGFRFDSRIAGGAIQEGFTMIAIKKAKLPVMPEEMKDELGGNELELNLTFFF